MHPPPPPPVFAYENGECSESSDRSSSDDAVSPDCECAVSTHGLLFNDDVRKRKECENSGAPISAGHDEPMYVGAAPDESEPLRPTKKAPRFRTYYDGRNSKKNTTWTWEEAASRPPTSKAKPRTGNNRKGTYRVWEYRIRVEESQYEKEDSFAGDHVEAATSYAVAEPGLKK